MGFDVSVMGNEVPAEMCADGNSVSCIMMFP
jgi:hypothetical protein